MVAKKLGFTQRVETGTELRKAVDAGVVGGKGVFEHDTQVVRLG